MPFDNSALRDAFRERMDSWTARVDDLAREYAAARPFPHIVIDDFLPKTVIDALEADFPGKGAKLWNALPTADQKGKLAIRDESELPVFTRAVIAELNSGSFLRFLERLTGIANLIADTKLVGGGLHRIEPGGKLSVHVDFSHHPTNGLNRRLNLLLYLNKDWPESYGGHFELWNEDITRCERKVLPVINRLAIFSTSPTSYHGHPEPLTCPPDRARQSLALYYFTVGRPGEEEVFHNTSFKSRPGERPSLGSFLARTAASGVFQELAPPVLYKAARRAWNRRFTTK